MKELLKVVLFPLVIILRKCRRYTHSPMREAKRALRYDRRRFLHYAGALYTSSRSAQLARIIMGYHVLEKGLTMPRRHLDFGHNAVLSLMTLVEDFIAQYGMEDPQVIHAIGCVQEYLALHQDENFDMGKGEFWSRIKSFCRKFSDVDRARQIEMTADSFFAHNDAPFPVFAASRHTSRHYQGVVPVERIRSAVELAMTAPSACNRQYVRVHCVSNHMTRDRIFELQNGNRGFGCDADKLLVVTADLSGMRWAEERNDIYTNAGIFIMNLCYSLHYKKVAHCILNWSVSPENDLLARSSLTLPESETIVSIIACGNAPDSFQVAASPRKSIGDVFREIK